MGCRETLVLELQVELTLLEVDSKCTSINLMLLSVLCARARAQVVT